MTWVVWRQDDHGNRFVVSRHASEGEAREAALDLERRGHKQLYFVEEDARARDVGADGRGGTPTIAS